MNEQQICEIAEKAFKAHFSDFEIVQIDVEQRLDHDGDKVVDVNIYCDGKNGFARGSGLLRVQSEIVSKAWDEVEDDFGFPLVHFYSKSALKQHNSMASKRKHRNSSNSQPRRSTGPAALP